MIRALSAIQCQDIKVTGEEFLYQAGIMMNTVSENASLILGVRDLPKRLFATWS